MGFSFLTPLFLAAGAVAAAIPLVVHLIRRHRGEPLAFPSLMFLRRLPETSVRRRQIRDWPLLLLRLAALLLLAAAFARPVFLDEAENAAEGEAFREVVIVLDRSWSMGLGDRWERAVGEVEEVLGGLQSPDRVSLVHYEGRAEVAVDPTLDPARVRSVLDTLRPGWGVPRIAAGLQAATGVLEASDRTRKEVVLVSDFQRRGWDDGTPERLPTGVTLATRDVGETREPVVAVAELDFRHEPVEGGRRVHPRARVVSVGSEAAGEGHVTLQIEGREAQALDVSLPAEGAATVEFDPVVLPEGGLRGAVEVSRGTDHTMAPYRFVLSDEELFTVLLVEGPQAASDGLHLRSALAAGADPPIRVERRDAAQLTVDDLDGVHVVLVQDAPLPGGSAGEAIRERVRAGMGLLVISGPRSAPDTWTSAWDEVLPARPGGPVDRDPARGAVLARVERDHPVFVPFAGAGGSGLGRARFYRYRSSVPVQVAPTGEGPGAQDGDAEDAAAQGAAGRAATSGEDSAGAPGIRDDASRVLARFDDGTPALVERRVDRGRVLLWTSSWSTGWTDLPLHPAFLPLVHETVRYAGGPDDGASEFTVGQAVAVSFLRTRAGFPESSEEPGGGAQEAGGAAVVLVSPGGVGAPLDDGSDAPDVAEPGFYEVREDDDPERSGFSFAVNMDLAAADAARIDPEEVVIAAAGASGRETGVEEAERAGSAAPLAAAGSMVESERRQSAWMWLLAALAAVLLVETLLANRSRGRLAREAAPLEVEGRTDPQREKKR